MDQRISSVSWCRVVDLMTTCGVCVQCDPMILRPSRQRRIGSGDRLLSPFKKPSQSARAVSCGALQCGWIFVVSMTFQQTELAISTGVPVQAVHLLSSNGHKQDALDLGGFGGPLRTPVKDRQCRCPCLVDQGGVATEQYTRIAPLRMSTRDEGLTSARTAPARGRALAAAAALSRDAASN